MNRSWLPVIIAGAVSLPGLALRLGLVEASDPVRALFFGIAIVGAAFLLSWAAEVIQLDVSQGLALALLALIAILPEYVVDASFAWMAAEDPAYAGYAVANMTGANRLLVGIAWPMVIAIIWFRTRKRSVTLGASHGLELIALLAATAYAFVIPFKGNISLFDCFVLAAIFIVYMWRLTRLPAEHPDLVGPAKTIGALPENRRRALTGVLALAAAGIVLLVAKAFAKSLVATGTDVGIDEFLLVQWLAPLASEAPEFVVVAIFAWRAAGAAALGTVVSSKVNQWTLLVGMLPLIYAIALGAIEPLPLDNRQEDEILLTAAQSLFAVALLLDRRLSVVGAGMLFGLFAFQFVWPDYRVELSVVYIVLAAATLIISRRHLAETFRGAWRPEENLEPET
ncbi:MAG: sodium:calcium antiporter [Thermomicrobiales bacterium]